MFHSTDSVEAQRLVEILEEACGGVIAEKVDGPGSGSTERRSRKQALEKQETPQNHRGSRVRAATVQYSTVQYSTSISPRIQRIRLYCTVCRVGTKY